MSDPIKPHADLTYVSGSIVDDSAEVLVNTVNCRLSPSGRGVMGKGVALAFRERFPTIMRDYEQAIRSGEMRPGRALLFDLPDGRKWAALGTKDDWRDPSRMEWIEDGLKDLGNQLRAGGFRSVAIPPPGCGNGGLDWKKVEPLVHKHLEGVAVKLYARPSGAMQGQAMPGPDRAALLAEQRAAADRARYPVGPHTPVAKRGSMYFEYGRDARPEIKSKTTFDAILDGERTSTTRYDSWAGTEAWGNLSPGSLVRFFEDKEMKGRSVVVKIDSIERVNLATMNASEREAWSKAEGWSVEHCARSGERYGTGFQIRYKPVPGQAILEGRGALSRVDDLESQRADRLAPAAAIEQRSPSRPISGLAAMLQASAGMDRS